jgi:3-hydroxyisobutyrate dehydrogenase
MTTKISWIGLGQMGTPMVSRLLSADIAVTVYNRTSSKAQAVVEKGATQATSVLAAVRANDTIFLMIADYQAALAIFSKEVLAELSGKTIVNMSTISPTQSKDLAKLVAKYNGEYIEAPVSGSVGAATAGSLLILTAGAQEKVTALQPIFNHLGGKTYFYGEMGSGTGAKLVLNALLGIFGEAYSEVLLLAEQFGINRSQILATIGHSGMNSPVFQAKKDMFENQNYPAAFMLKHQSKDLSLATSEMATLKLALPLTSATEKNYRLATEKGLGEQDMASVYFAIEKLAHQVD